MFIDCTVQCVARLSVDVFRCNGESSLWFGRRTVRQSRRLSAGPRQEAAPDSGIQLRPCRNWTFESVQGVRRLSKINRSQRRSPRYVQGP